MPRTWLINSVVLTATSRSWGQNNNTICLHRPWVASIICIYFLLYLRWLAVLRISSVSSWAGRRMIRGYSPGWFAARNWIWFGKPWMTPTAPTLPGGSHRQLKIEKKGMRLFHHLLATKTNIKLIQISLLWGDPLHHTSIIFDRILHS